MIPPSGRWPIVVRCFEIFGSGHLPGPLCAHNIPTARKLRLSEWTGEWDRSFTPSESTRFSSGPRGSARLVDVAAVYTFWWVPL